MKLLMNEADFKEWKNSELSVECGDQAVNPSTYPCYAYTRIFDWSKEYTKAVYLYDEDITNMMHEILGASAEEYKGYTIKDYGDCQITAKHEDERGVTTFISELCSVQEAKSVIDKLVKVE